MGFGGGGRDRTKPCNQHVERIVCSLHDLIMRGPDGAADEGTPVVDQVAADREALARVMFGPGVDWASCARLRSLLDSTIELGFPRTGGFTHTCSRDCCCCTCERRNESVC